MHDKFIIGFTREQVLASSTEYFQGDTLPAGVFADKYALRDKEDHFFERTPDDMHWRLAREFARIEAKYPNPLSEETIYGYLKNFSKIVPQGSPMFGIGNDFALVSTSNCAVIAGPKDTMSSIFDTARDMANLYKRRFGVGTDLSGLRPEGASVNNAAGSSTGAWSFADFYSYVTRMVGQSGRRGALMLTMDVRHPDIEKFITMKADLTKVTGANVSVKVSDAFMRAVENDEEFTLRWPVEAASKAEWYEDCEYALNFAGYAKVERVVKARDIFRLIAEQATKTAEPGILFWDTITQTLPLDGYAGFRTTSTNPCGELPLAPNDSCRLISIPLPTFVVDEFTEKARIDWNDFEDTVAVAMRLCDDLVDLELEKLQAIHDTCDTEDERRLFAQFIVTCRDGRRTGLGMHGLGDLLARLRVPYDSDDAIRIAEELYEDLAYCAYETSIALATERGAFPAWDARAEAECAFFDHLEHLDGIRGPRRNGSILTNAPTGSVSILSNNCSSGIEPVFANVYERKRKLDPSKDDLTGAYKDASGDYWATYKVYHPNAEYWYRLALADPQHYGIDWERVRGLSSAAFKDLIPLPEYFVTSADIDPMARVRMQGAIQKSIDHSISSTINLPKGTTPDVVEALYLAAWKAGCKGVTVYVDGSRDAQVLSTGTTKSAGAIKIEHDMQLAMTHGRREEAERDRDRWRLAATEAQDKFENLRTRFLKLERTVPQECRTRTHRGQETSGEMVKASFRDRDGHERKVYVYVGLNEAGQPVEVFIHDQNGDPDFHPYAMALGKMISLLLKYDVPCEDIEGALLGLQGGSVSYSGKIYSSVPDLVSRRLTAVREAVSASKPTPEAFRDQNPVTTWSFNPPLPPGTSWSYTATRFVLTDDAGQELASGPIGAVPPAVGGVVEIPLTVRPEHLNEERLLAQLWPEKYPLERKFTTGAPPTMGKKLCPQCGSTEVRPVDGCPLCPDCGWSKC